MASNPPAARVSVVRPAVQFTVGSLATWMAAAVAGPSGREWFFGMLAPLVAAVVSWVVVARTVGQRPERVTSVMMVAFAVKLVFFGAYVVVMLRGLALRPVPFVVAFTAYFIGLHVAEAWWLRRLFAAGASGPRPE